MSGTITSNGQKIKPGESFHPIEGDDYAVTYVGIQQTDSEELLILRDNLGELTKVIHPAPGNTTTNEN